MEGSGARCRDTDTDLTGDLGMCHGHQRTNLFVGGSDVAEAITVAFPLTKGTVKLAHSVAPWPTRKVALGTFNQQESNLERTFADVAAYVQTIVSTGEISAHSPRSTARA